MANKNITKYIIDNAPVKRSEVCAALNVGKYLVTHNLVDLAREGDRCPVRIMSFTLPDKDVLYTTKPSPFALAQQFIMNKKYVPKTKSATTNSRTRKTDAAQY